jgi:methyl-accepting chemotaxis protein
MSPDVASQLLEDAKRTQEQSEQASSSVSMAAMNARMVAGMMGEMQRGLSDVSRQVNEWQKLSEKSQAETEHTVENLKEFTAEVNRIASSVEVIETIADQIRMLALNAALEAARAGEYGRGFAVVASEVKELARQAAHAAEEVNLRLQSIHGAEARVEASVRTVYEGFAGVGKFTASVITSMTEHHASLDTITQYAQETAESAEGVVATLDGISSAAAETVGKLQEAATN